MKRIGLYLHIPFCARKCAYCDFPSYPGRMGLAEDYVNAVIREMDARAGDYIVDTFYIGGGTPSLMPPRLMTRLLSALAERFLFDSKAERSCEANPGALSERFLECITAAGVNRLSLGAQASQQTLLKRLNRLHRWEDVAHAVTMARSAGIDNVNLDIMLGLPGQTLAHVSETLDAALALSPTHLSCYGLILEEGTPLKAEADAGDIGLPGEDEERAMYELCRQKTAAAGFVQYEISNFALPGRECRHNVDCWRRKEYIGLGCAACGFIGDTRYRNAPGLDDYLSGAAPEETQLSPKDARFETVMLGLRMMAGVREGDFYAAHGMTLVEAFGDKLNAPLREGLLTLKNGVLALTRQGMDMQNRVLVALL